MNNWTTAVTAKKGGYSSGINSPDARYRVAMTKTLAMINEAYLAASEPAPHPVRWKRLLRRPYRKCDPDRLLAELHSRKPVP